MAPDPSIADNLAAVRERIAQACARSRRDPGEVTLVAVSKTKPLAAIEAAIAAGQQLFGENRVQEALQKLDDAPLTARWHLVGNLQRNKARHVAGRFELIHSVDDARLARELDKRCRAAHVAQPVLIQVNLSEEPTKHGARAEDTLQLAQEVLGCEALRLGGLMTIPPPAGTPEDNREWFAALRDLRDQLQDELGRPLPHLSMGMTDDFEVAIEEGATLIRVGTAIFGAR